MELVIDSLTIARGGVSVLRGVDFRVPAGQALILRGPNGVGKTTLLRTIAGLQPAVAGHVSPGPDRVAYAGHADAVKATLSVEENLAFWAAVYGAMSFQPALERLALLPLRDRAAQTLSAGQKRRLGLARLLLADRPVWALDEPTVSLDAGSVGLFGGLVEEHLARGGSAVLTSHVDMGLAFASELDLSPWRATTAAGPARSAAGFDEAFL
jgi:heme exporter protein A